MLPLGTLVDSKPKPSQVPSPIRISPVRKPARSYDQALPSGKVTLLSSGVSAVLYW